MGGVEGPFDIVVELAEWQALFIRRGWTFIYAAIRTEIANYLATNRI